MAGMSRRTHGLVALATTALLVVGLVATGLLVATLSWWWAPANTPMAEPFGTPGPVPSATTTSPADAESPDPSDSPGPTTVPGGTLTPCPREGETHELTVVTFNIHGGRGDAGPDLPRIASEIAATGAEVVLLQEVDRFRTRTGDVDQPAALAGLLGMEQVYRGNSVLAGPSPGDPDQERGNAILTSLPVEGWRHLLLPNLPRREQRGLLQVRLRVADQTISVYNTHLDHTTPTLRQAQMRLARDVVATDPAPVLFGGDFNATPDSPALRLALDPEHADLHDPWPLVGDGEGLTVPPNLPRRRIDYVLASSDWRPVAARTWRSAVSDHRGLAVDLELQAPRLCG